MGHCYVHFDFVFTLRCKRNAKVCAVLQLINTHGRSGHAGGAVR